MNGFVGRNDPSLIIVQDWKDFVVWVKECGYDESYLDVNDSKCHTLQLQYIEEEEYY